MLLYHYTCKYHLEKIRLEGLTRGEVPITPTFCLNAVWFTSDNDPQGHGLGGEKMREATAQEKMFLGIPPQQKAFFPNKREVRISVELREDEVIPWLPWAKDRLDPKWLNTLNRAGGGLKKAKTWFMCFERIPPDRFARIDLL